MPRSPVLPATMTLAALTAVALLAAGLAIRPTHPVAPGDRAAANRAAVRIFYEAVNSVIATGDPAPLSSVLTADYAEPDAAGMSSSGREALERVLLSLHATAPGLRLAAESLVAEGDRVIAVVRTDGSDRAAFLGLGLTAAPLWGLVDVFRVTAGLVAERTSAGSQVRLLEPLIEAPVELRPPGERVVTAVRVTVSAGGWRRVPATDGPRLLVVEAGALAVAGTADDIAALPGDDAPALGTGGWQIVADGEAYATRNPGHEPAVFLEVLVAPSTAQPGAASATVEGATTQVLAGGQVTAVPTGPAVLAVGRVTLSSDARLALAPATGPVLLVVEAGTLGLAEEGTTTWIRRATGEAARSLGVAMLAAGDGALIGATASAEGRNAGDGPVEVLVIALLGAKGAPTSPETPSPAP